MSVELRRVKFMPAALEPNIVYFAEEYGAAAHLCACGCGSKVRTPIGPTWWSLIDGPSGVSLTPSIGNWQQPCRSHYWITDGEVVWSNQWTDEEVAEGRKQEQARRDAYYAARQARPAKRGFLRRLWGKFFH